MWGAVAPAHVVDYGFSRKTISGVKLVFFTCASVFPGAASALLSERSADFGVGSIST